MAAPVGTLQQVADFAGLAPSAPWISRLAALRFPDRNESWRAKLDPVVVRRIEAAQAERLHQYGYPVD